MAKKFKIKIKGIADVNEGTGVTKTFSQEANEWYKAEGRNSLENWFKDKQVVGASFLENFSFDENVDGVDKEKETDYE